VILFFHLKSHADIARREDSALSMSCFVLQLRRSNAVTPHGVVSDGRNTGIDLGFKPVSALGKPIHLTQTHLSGHSLWTNLNYINIFSIHAKTRQLCGGFWDVVAKLWGFRHNYW